MNPTITAFGYPQNLIREFEHWVVLLRPSQVTVGSMVICAKSEATSLAELSGEVWAEFATVSHYCETTVKAHYPAQKYNYLALMMKDPNVHFHFIPRYAEAVKVGKSSYEDLDWPLKTELRGLEMSDSDYVIMLETLKS